jgi:hypothetical protein
MLSDDTVRCCTRSTKPCERCRAPNEPRPHRHAVFRRRFVLRCVGQDDAVCSSSSCSAVGGIEDVVGGRHCRCTFLLHRMRMAGCDGGCGCSSPSSAGKRPETRPATRNRFDVMSSTTHTIRVLVRIQHDISAPWPSPSGGCCIRQPGVAKHRWSHDCQGNPPSPAGLVVHQPHASGVLRQRLCRFRFTIQVRTSTRHQC